MSGRVSLKGLRLFLDDEAQQTWLDGVANPSDGNRPDPSERNGIEQRFKYAARFEKLLGKPQAENVLALLRAYAASCLPIPRTTERFYWSVSCMPSTDKALARVNASWMELFALMPDGEKTWARIIVHLADFTTDGSVDPDSLDRDFLERCVEGPQDVDHHFWGKDDILVIKVRGAGSIRSFLADPRALRAIRKFNLKYMNRGRNAYQASHCYRLADAMLD